MKHHLFFYFQAILNLPYGIFLMFSPGAVLASHFTGPWEMTGGLDFIARAYGSLLAAVGTTALVKALGKSNLNGNVLMFIGLTGSVFYSVIHIGALNKGTLGPSSIGTLVAVILLGIWALVLLLKKPAPNL